RIRRTLPFGNGNAAMPSIAFGTVNDASAFEGVRDSLSRTTRNPRGIQSSGQSTLCTRSPYPPLSRRRSVLAAVASLHRASPPSDGATSALLPSAAARRRKLRRSSAFMSVDLPDLDAVAVEQRDQHAMAAAVPA